jgi:hypothetical protein
VLKRDKGKRIRDKTSYLLKDEGKGIKDKNG